MPRDVCLFNIMQLPPDTLKKVLPKASTRLLARLASAYPRVAGHSFLELLSQCVSPVTLEFLREEINVAQLPSFQQIHWAESELMKIIAEEEPPRKTARIS